MVSIRRRKGLGYTTGIAFPEPMLFDDEAVAYFPTPPGTPVNSSIPSIETRSSSTKVRSPKKTRPSSSANQSNRPSGDGSPSAKKQLDLSLPDDEENLRKKNKRKCTQEQERLRGVYFKNMKWQAAIKVDKRQIHLGTVDSEAEAARLYDRAAFMCGRAPNFELPEEDKEELIKLEWEQFLSKTKDEILNKRYMRRQISAGTQNKPNVSVLDHGAKRALTLSRDAEPEGSTS